MCALFLTRCLSMVRCRPFPLMPRRCSSSTAKVPRSPTWKVIEQSDLPKPVEVSEELVRYLERTSLVQFSDEDGLRQLHEAIQFANILSHVNTDGVEPLHSLNENEVAYLREDVVTEGNCREELLSQSARTVEDWYFVAPPGNVPLEQGSTNKPKPKED